MTSEMADECEKIQREGMLEQLAANERKVAGMEHRDERTVIPSSPNLLSTELSRIEREHQLERDLRVYIADTSPWPEHRTYQQGGCDNLIDMLLNIIDGDPDKEIEHCALKYCVWDIRDRYSRLRLHRARVDRLIEEKV